MQCALRILTILIISSGMGATVEQALKEVDSKATESLQVRVGKAELDGKGKIVQAAPTAEVMLVSPISLMLAVPHPSGRFLMLIPTQSQMVPIVPMPYTRQDHPAIFAARHQLLYKGPSNHQQQSRQQFRENHQQYLTPGYLRRLPIDIN